MRCIRSPALWMFSATPMELVQLPLEWGYMPVKMPALAGWHTGWVV